MHSTEALLSGLNSEQAEAVKHTTGPLLIVAGAGTGKTTVITRKIAFLIEQGYAKPEEILALTFTDKAAGEMQERADMLLPLGYNDIWISTFHSFGERVLKSHGLDIGLPNDFRLLNEIQAWILLHNNFEKLKLDYYRPIGSPNRFIDSLLTHFSRCKDELITPSEYLTYAEELKLGKQKPTSKRTKEPKKLVTETQEIDQTEIARIQELANAFSAYQKLLHENDYLDFGDLINCTLELFTRRPQVLNRFRKKFKYIMVDEFQDTNFAQYQLVKALAGDQSNLTVVGDDDQSIYKFRGASVSNILKFKEDFPTCKEITLVENYRSSQNILDLAYNFIQANNPDRLEVKLKINKHLKAVSEKGEGVISVLESDDLGAELNSVAKKILEIYSSEGSGASWNDFAVLMRANSAAEEIIPIFDSYHIPYTFLANKGLYKKPIVLDVLSYMRILDNISDSKSLYRVLSLPKFNISHLELSVLSAYAHKKTINLFDAIYPALTFPELSEEAKSSLKFLWENIRTHSEMAKSFTAAEMLVRIIRDLSFEKTLSEESDIAAQAREHLEQFYKRIEEFEKQNEYKSLHEFLLDLSLEMKAGSEGAIKFDPNSGPESVKIMTVHASKGLEFKNVFLVNMVDQRFPTRQKSESIEIPEKLVKDILPQGDFHLQEERRLFYVAVTRAKNKLFLSWAKDYGGSRTKKPSQFLVETSLVPSEKINRATGKVVFTKPLVLQSVSQKEGYASLPNKFSYTQLTDFENCPLKYKYVHYLKIPWVGSHHMSFGSSIHKTFEEFLKQYKNNQELTQLDLFGKRPSEQPLPDFSLLENYYEKFWIDDWYPSKDEKEKYRQMGRRMMRYFYDNLDNQKPVAKYIEKFFKLKLGEFDFVGKIDRADQLNNGLEIIDYKTGKTPKTKKDFDQLYIYQWAAEEFLKEKVLSLKYWYLQENDFVEESLATNEEIQTLKEKLKGLMHRVVEAVKYNQFKELHKKTKEHNCEFLDLE
ncbi:MAG: UvrD-helicase domain-containing protein [Candidatus Doudnabacteria bacterium]|nr:UvrD-helicase domain-containing protein [Candidatus Doudnabacteria bacterium]